MRLPKPKPLMMQKLWWSPPRAMHGCVAITASRTPKSPAPCWKVHIRWASSLWASSPSATSSSLGNGQASAVSRSRLLRGAKDWRGGSSTPVCAGRPHGAPTRPTCRQCGTTPGPLPSTRHTASATTTNTATSPLLPTEPYVVSADTGVSRTQRKAHGRSEGLVVGLLLAADLIGGLVVRRLRFGFHVLPAPIERAVDVDVEALHRRLRDTSVGRVILQSRLAEIPSRRHACLDVPHLGRIHLNCHHTLAARRALLNVGADQDAILRVVPELQIEAPPIDGGLATDRITGDVEVVRMVLDVGHPSEKGRVVCRGDHLRHSAAKFLAEHAAVDDRALGETIGNRPFAKGVVETERLPRLDERAVKQLRGTALVDVAIGSGVVGGRKLADLFGDLERFGVLRREFRFDDLGLDLQRPFGT